LNYGMVFTDGGIFSASVNNTYERLATSFRIGPLAVAPGEHRFTDVAIGYVSNRAARLSGTVELQGGSFWTGRQRALNTSLRLRVSAHLAASLTAGRSVVTLPEGSFTGDLVGLRIDTSFTPRMFLNAFIQYNGETDTWLSNIRYNLIHRPLSDVYVVWNETRLAGDISRALMLKYTHLITF
jgi:hypothetical protein